LTATTVIESQILMVSRLKLTNKQNQVRSFFGLILWKGYLLYCILVSACTIDNAYNLFSRLWQNQSNNSKATTVFTTDISPCNTIDQEMCLVVVIHLTGC